MHEFTSSNLMSNLVSLAAAILGLSAHLHKNQASLKLQIGLSSQVWALYFLLLDLPTAQYIQIATGLRTWISIYVGKNPALKIPYFIIAVTGLFMAMILTWEGILSILPTLAAINSTIAYLFDNKRMRIMLLGSSILSLSFAALIQSPLLMILECLGLGINLMAIRKTFTSGAPE